MSSLLLHGPHTHTAPPNVLAYRSVHADWRCIQNEDGVEITLGTKNDLFSLPFVWPVLICLKDAVVEVFRRRS